MTSLRRDVTPGEAEEGVRQPRREEPMTANYAEMEAARRLLEQAVTPCPECGSDEVLAAVAPPGKRERAIYLRCQRCGQERADLEFYEQAA
jgi:hypothetical protein